MNKIVFITDASSGIGEATAHLFAKNNFSEIITGRRAEHLTDLANVLREKYNTDILPISFDVRDQQAIDTARKALPDNWKNISVLNNAGLATGKDPIQSGKRGNWQRMIDTNVK